MQQNDRVPYYYLLVTTIIIIPLPSSLFSLRNKQVFLYPCCSPFRHVRLLPLPIQMIQSTSTSTSSSILPGNQDARLDILKIGRGILVPAHWKTPIVRKPTGKEGGKRGGQKFLTPIKYSLKPGPRSTGEEKWMEIHRKEWALMGCGANPRSVWIRRFVPYSVWS